MSKKRQLRRSSASAPRRDMAEFVRALPIGSVALGLTHLTSGYFLQDIAACMQLQPRSCQVFKKEYLYLFYGRPCYRKPQHEEPADIFTEFPVIFILNPASISAPSRVYPFDSGAFAAGMYEGIHDNYVLLEDFELDDTLDSAKAIASGIFGSNVAYLRNEKSHSEHLKPEADNAEAHNYFRILNARGRISNVTANLVDDRASAVELIYDKPINLQDCTLAILVPSELAAGKKTGGLLASVGLPVIPYNWSKGSRPIEYFETFREIAISIYKDKGLL